MRTRSQKHHGAPITTLTQSSGHREVDCSVTNDTMYQVLRSLNHRHANQTLPRQDIAMAKQSLHPMPPGSIHGFGEPARPISQWCVVDLLTRKINSPWRNLSGPPTYDVEAKQPLSTRKYSRTRRRAVAPQQQQKKQ